MILDSFLSLAEESAQNFVDEDVKGEEVSGACSAKRIKTRAADGSSNDQVLSLISISFHCARSS